jgi:hypothetical protein
VVSRVCFSFNRTYMSLAKPLNHIAVNKHLSDINLDKFFQTKEWSHNLGTLPEFLIRFFEKPIQKIGITDELIIGYNKQNVEIISFKTFGPIKETFDKLITRDPVLRQVIIPSKYNPSVYNIKYK